MGKKQKQEYSMTAKERKALRRGTAAAPATEEPQPTETEVTETQTTATAVVSRKNIWIMITGVVLALVIILTAVLLLVLLPRSSSKYPRAVITLNDGTTRRTMTMTIWEEESPIAATNFMFLAQIGFFDGTIVYDVESDRNYMRFGAYKGYGTDQTRYVDDEFIAGISTDIFNIVNLESASNYTAAQRKRFGYRLRKDTSNDAKRYNEAYVVSYNNNNAADFVINLVDGNSNFTNKTGGSNIKDNLSAFGQFEDEESQAVLRWLYELEKNENPGLANVIGTSPVVTIESVKIENYDKKKWKNFEFVSYMNTANNGSSAWLSWVG